MAKAKEESAAKKPKFIPKGKSWGSEGGPIPGGVLLKRFREAAELQKGDIENHDTLVALKKVLTYTKESDCRTPREKHCWLILKEDRFRFLSILTQLERDEERRSGDLVVLKAENERLSSQVSSLTAEVERLRGEVSSLSPAVPDLSADDGQKRLEELLGRYLSGGDGS